MGKTYVRHPAYAQTKTSQQVSYAQGRDGFFTHKHTHAAGLAFSADFVGRDVLKVQPLHHHRTLQCMSPRHLLNQ